MPNELMNTSAIETIDSREVAEMIEVRHDNLVKKIRNYQQILDSSKLRSQDFLYQAHTSIAKIKNNLATY